MNKKIVFTLFVVVFILIIVNILVVFQFDNNVEVPKTINNPNALNFSPIETGSTYSGDVLIELIPEEISDGKVIIELKANTHSVDLSKFDLAELTSLEYNGKIIKPSSAPRLEGHHSSGAIIFDVNEKPDSLKVTINNIPKVKERIFYWETR